MLNDDRFRVIRIPLGIILVGLIVVGLFSKRGFRDWRTILRKNDELRARILEVETQKRDLERRNYLIQNSADEQERVIRRVLGYVRPQETVVEFD
ncbi:MAG: septum formation initiator family protein [Deltaproteobacteria bacterium]|nr:septum formation initiator family protein [Deltaproteobacteria bacterium]MBI3294561.1 septum formation initiator family protein [Deltaproteobacteria bacterium]